MLFHHFHWDLTHQVLFLYILSSHHMNFERPVLKMHILWCRTDICSCKLSVKVPLVLDNPFPVQSLCKLNHISICFIQISTKITCKQLISFRENHVFFWSDPWCFGLHGKFQHNTKISMNSWIKKQTAATELEFSSVKQIWNCAAQRELEIHSSCIESKKNKILSLGTSKTT